MPAPALLIDWGGVMTGDLFVAFDEFAVAEGLAPGAIPALIRADRSVRQALIAFEEGRIDDDAFAGLFADGLGLPGSRSHGMIDRMMAGATPDPVMVDFVRRVRGRGVRTVLLSNSWGADRYPTALLDELFDAVTISGSEGVRKPAPEIYRIAAGRAGVPPDACVFVDDLDFNLVPAAELGMATVLHREPAETIARVESLLVAAR